MRTETMVKIWIFFAIVLVFVMLPMHAIRERHVQNKLHAIPTKQSQHLFMLKQEHMAEFSQVLQKYTAAYAISEDIWIDDVDDIAMKSAEKWIVEVYGKSQ